MKERFKQIWQRQFQTFSIEKAVYKLKRLPKLEPLKKKKDNY